jgi:hypothetical protein
MLKPVSTGVQAPGNTFIFQPFFSWSWVGIPPGKRRLTPVGAPQLWHFSKFLQLSALSWHIFIGDINCIFTDILWKVDCISDEFSTKHSYNALKSGLGVFDWMFIHNVLIFYMYALLRWQVFQQHFSFSCLWSFVNVLRCGNAFRTQSDTW